MTGQAQFPGEQSKTGEFDRYTDSPIDLYPEYLRKAIDKLTTFSYENVNKRVYLAGIAIWQQVCERGSTAIVRQA